MSETTKALLPCPFCGTAPDVECVRVSVERDPQERHARIVADVQCRCGRAQASAIRLMSPGSRLDLHRDATLSFLAERWNARAPFPGIVDIAASIMERCDDSSLREWAQAVVRHNEDGGRLPSATQSK